MSNFLRLKWTLLLSCYAFFLRQVKSSILKSADTVSGLPWGDINVIALTDVHSWVSGQKHLYDKPADYGDVLSFYKSLPHDEKDIFFVMNGDFMDGTGISSIPPTHHLPILLKMNWDVGNVGNHELYHAETLRYMVDSGFIDHWGGNYLSSNTVWKESNEPIGNRYTYLRATHNNASILVFGFLFDFEHNCNTTKVVKVEETVQQEWFVSVLRRQDYEAILVLAHMDFESNLVSVIHNSIRGIAGASMPVQFINGHSHRRGWKQLDNSGSAMEPGHFMDTVGFASFPLSRTIDQTPPSERPSLFGRVFLDSTVPVLEETITETCPGEHSIAVAEGNQLSSFIQDTRDDLGLDEVVGCASHTYQLGRSITDSSSSLVDLYMNEIIRVQLIGNDPSLVFIQGVGMLRYPLFEGNVVLDDIIATSPFNDTVYSVVDEIGGRDLRLLLHNVKQSSVFAASLSEDEIIDDQRYLLLSTDFDAPRVCALAQKAVRHDSNIACTLVPYKRVSDSSGSLATVLILDLFVEYIRKNWTCPASDSRIEAWTDTSKLVFVSAGAVICVVLALGSLWASKRWLCIKLGSKDSQDDAPSAETKSVLTPLIRDQQPGQVGDAALSYGTAPQMC